MPRFKNISGDVLHVGRADGPTVKADDVIAVDGDVLEELADAYIVGTAGNEDDRRAWPKETWKLLTEPKSTEKGE